jgi:HD superfamily phosphodiesterase
MATTVARLPLPPPPSGAEAVKGLDDLLEARAKTLEEMRARDAQNAIRRETAVRGLAADAVKSFNAQSLLARQAQIQADEDTYKKERQGLQAIVDMFDVLIEVYLARDPEESRRLLQQKLDDLKERKEEEDDAFEDQIEKLQAWLRDMPAKAKRAARATSRKAE